LGILVESGDGDGFHLHARDRLPQALSRRGFHRSTTRHGWIPDLLNLPRGFTDARFPDRYVCESVQLEIVHETPMIAAVRLITNHMLRTACKKQSQQSLERPYVVDGQPGEGKLLPELDFWSVNRFRENLRYPAKSTLSFQTAYNPCLTVLVYWSKSVRLIQETI
jgi:hypothetical protein